MITFTLHPEREKSLKRRHPWIFSKAVATVHDEQGKEINKKSVASGTLCQVNAADGSFLCYAHYSAASQILLRVISFKQDDVQGDKLRPDLVLERLTAAKARRASLLARGEGGVRLVAAEGDYLPGLIVDKFNNVIVLALNSWGMEALYEPLVQGLHALFPECTLYERSDAKARLTERLPLRVGYIDPDDISTTYNLVDQPAKKITPNGTTIKEIPATLYVRENNLVEMPIDVLQGHKTGGYLDQRASRYHCYELCQELKALSENGKTGPSVLNCFCYTGGFCLSALKGGARSVHNIDVSQPALDAAKAGVVHNRLDPGRCKFINCDVFEFLRKEVKLGHKYDVVILDPPKFVLNKSTLVSGSRGYQDINRLGLKLVAPGGHLLTFSCSGLMTEELFQKIVADAALEAEVEAQIIGTMRQDRDHIVSLPCPESFYLKGLDILVS